MKKKKAKVTVVSVKETQKTGVASELHGKVVSNSIALCGAAEVAHFQTANLFHDLSRRTPANR